MLAFGLFRLEVVAAVVAARHGERRPQMTLQLQSRHLHSTVHARRSLVLALPQPVDVELEAADERGAPRLRVRARHHRERAARRVLLEALRRHERLGGGAARPVVAVVAAVPLRDRLPGGEDVERHTPRVVPRVLLNAEGMVVVREEREMVGRW